MLREHVGVRQHAGESHRRFFWDDYLQLYVWFDEDERIVGFELSYDLTSDYRAFRWKPADGVEHYRVDDGEGRAMKKAVPVMRVDRSGIDPDILVEFTARSESISPEISLLVKQRLREFLAT